MSVIFERRCWLRILVTRDLTVSQSVEMMKKMMTQSTFCFLKEHKGKMPLHTMRFRPLRWHIQYQVSCPSIHSHQLTRKSAAWWRMVPFFPKQHDNQMIRLPEWRSFQQLCRFLLRINSDAKKLSAQDVPSAHTGSFLSVRSSKLGLHSLARFRLFGLSKSST